VRASLYPFLHVNVPGAPSPALPPRLHWRDHPLPACACAHSTKSDRFRFLDPNSIPPASPARVQPCSGLFTPSAEHAHRPLSLSRLDTAWSPPDHHRCLHLALSQ
jgi:hypothetical protein